MDLVTGGSGFIGKRLVRDLQRAEQSLRILSRRSGVAENIIQGDLINRDFLSQAVSGISRVFHCAGYAHAFSSFSGEDSALHWQVNFEGTRNLLNAAGEAGVKRFVFLSSLKAMAEPGNAVVDENLVGAPETAYGQAKLAAEAAVLEAGKRYGMHVVNLRLAMVYGFGGRGNLERMGRLVGRGVFPPLPETGNHRSLVHVDDVVAAMRLVANDDRANGRTYIVAGQEAPSGRQLYDALRDASGMPPCRWAVPEAALRLVARIGDGLELVTRRRLPLDSEALERLLGSAWYSSALIERELGWRAKISLGEGLREMFGNASKRP